MVDMAAKREVLIEYERAMARKLALDIFDRPRPQIWMILVPIFLVFFMQKVREYSSGLDDFVDNYMRPRLAALDHAAQLLTAGNNVQGDRMQEMLSQVPENARPLFVDWMDMLTEHYQSLLQADGDDAGTFIRAAYRTKTDYLLWCNALNRVENSYNLALMPDIAGEQEDVGCIVRRMHDSLVRLRRQEADTLYG